MKSALLAGSALLLQVAGGCATTPGGADAGPVAAAARATPAPGAAPQPGGDRGVTICAEHAPCYDDAELGPLTLDDVSVKLLRVGANGAMTPLVNGQSLRTGERFTILVRAARDAHVYLFHRDPSGRGDELLRASGLLAGQSCHDWNRFRAGQAMQLPDSGEHYSLAGAPGLERIQVVVSGVPLCDAGRNVVDHASHPVCRDRHVLCPPELIIRHITET